MDNTAKRNICLRLLHAESEDDVVDILEEFGWWNTDTVWRYFGDREGNFSVIGNQQSKPEAALVEKLINSIDARLMGECLARGIDPEGQAAPASIREAVALFFEERAGVGNIGGNIEAWDNVKRKTVGEEITVAVTGSRRTPSVTVTDLGEGQVPSAFPDTFLSIDRTNKLRIRFVQGKFNMGGTGVLQFCGKHNLQLIISRRSPHITENMPPNESEEGQWGFTIVRRHSPQGSVRNSVYSYLAPAGELGQPSKQHVLSFQADSLPLRPEGNQPYSRDTGWGTAIKLYDYDMKGFTSHALMKGGLLTRMETMLPEPALPIRVHECRDFKGHAGSFATTLSGLAVRLSDNVAGNLEFGFPDSVPFRVEGEEMLARIYAFQKGKADSYRTNEGIILTVNGQTHGFLPKTFFSRKSVRLGRIADSLLVVIDCTSISNRAREDLFMNSRDRLRSRGLRKSLEENLEDILRQHPGLRALGETRKAEEITERLSNSKPLEEVLASVMRASPSLSALFLSGTRLARPSKQGGNTGMGNSGSGTKEGSNDFKGREHPTFFKFKKKKQGELLQRNCEIGRRLRIDFETDVANDYFSRSTNRGRFLVAVLEGTLPEDNIDWSLTLHQGLAHASIEVSQEAVVGDTITLQFAADDDVISEAFINVARVNFVAKVERPGSPGHKKKQTGAGEGGEESQSGIELPEYRIIEEAQWGEHGFDKYSACHITQEHGQDDDERDIYTFYINGDNLYLKTEMKHGNGDPALMKAKFVYGLILVGLGLMREYRDIEKKMKSETHGNGDSESWVNAITIEDYVRETTRALAPFMLPIIDRLGSLSEEELEIAGEAGDDE